ncbi:MAG: FAD-dependent oxidoreductase [Puniceicoccales bacterium]
MKRKRALQTKSSISDLYEDPYDIVVHGAGYIGFGAVRKLAEAGQRVLLTESTGLLLWESSFALENGLGEGVSCREWGQWLDGLADQSAVCENAFDPVVAEISAARYLHRNPAVETLLYAIPVAVQEADGSLAAVTYATKEGFRRVRAHRWIDASETGELANCLQGRVRESRAAAARLCRMVLQSPRWQEMDASFEEYADSQGMRWRKGVRETERHLIWEDDGAPWHQALLQRVRDLRSAFAGKWAPLVSHSSGVSFPVYESGTDGGSLDVPTNLRVMSPGWNSIPLRNVADRYSYGSQLAEQALSLSSVSDRTDLEAMDVSSVPVVRDLSCDVLVAGAGTAGALAALASGSHGADTLALEFAPYPGGIGTGGGITSYFYGLPGGLQEELGQLTEELTAMFQGDSHRPGRNYWHHDAKKIAILSEFDRYGIRFCGGSLLCGAENSGGMVRNVFAVVDGKLSRVAARAYIDSTGDGDLCSYAGADFTTGRVGDSRTLAFSQAAFTLDYTQPELDICVRNFDAGWLNATDARDLSRSRLSGLAQYHQVVRDEEKLPLYFAPLLGVRESRHIQTDYVLKMDDLVMERHFEDCIGRAGSHADTHSVDFEFEDDETVFFYWVCRLFRYPLRTELPYRMLLPKGLENVWIACRAAGMSANVFYGIRMQRDMQRLGEAAGVAAALSTREGGGGRSREVPVDQLREVLTRYEVKDAGKIDRVPVGDPVVNLRQGESGVPLWLIYREPKRYRDEVITLLDSPDQKASFYAACILAMWKDPQAEERLLEAIVHREEGETDPSQNFGAYGQEIDIPFWLLAVTLLRCCGTARCVPTLLKLAGDPGNILNVRSAIALTLERLVDRREIQNADAERMVAMLQDQLEDTVLTPSHSISRRLRKQEQKVLINHYMEPIREDHAWQLHLVLCRIRLKLGLPPHQEVVKYREDPRNFVRQAFAELCADSSR